MKAIIRELLILIGCLPIAIVLMAFCCRPISDGTFGVAIFGITTSMPALSMLSYFWPFVYLIINLLMQFKLRFGSVLSNIFLLLTVTWIAYILILQMPAAEYFVSKMGSPEYADSKFKYLHLYVKILWTGEVILSIVGLIALAKTIMIVKKRWA